MIRRQAATAYLRSMQAGVSGLRRISPALYGFFFRNDDFLDQQRVPLPCHPPPGARWLDAYRHPPGCGKKECIIIGKGPSVDRLTPAMLRGRLVCCVNDAYRMVPGHAYVFFHDTVVCRHISCLQQQQKTLVLPHLLSEHGTFHGTGDILRQQGPASLPRTLFYEKKEVYSVPFSRSYTSFLGSHPRCLLALSGTVHSAIAFAWRCGIRKIILIGFDGKTRGNRLYGEDFPNVIPSRYSLVVYRKIRWDTRVLAAALGLSCVFFDK